jgi:hypothetical protein
VAPLAEIKIVGTSVQVSSRQWKGGRGRGSDRENEIGRDRVDSGSIRRSPRGAKHASKERRGKELLFDAMVPRSTSRRS